MKISRSLSIELNIWSDFTTLTQEKGLDHNAVIGKLMRGWVKDQKLMDVKIVECPVCGSKYSENLGTCPDCEVNKIETQKKEAVDKESKDRELTKREQKVIELETEIKSYENALKRIDDPEGANLSEDERLENRARINATLIELRAALEEAKK